MRRPDFVESVRRMAVGKGYDFAAALMAESTRLVLGFARSTVKGTGWTGDPDRPDSLERVPQMDELLARVRAAIAPSAAHPDAALDLQEGARLALLDMGYEVHVERHH